MAMIQKYSTGTWVNWDHQYSADEAIERVKGYCMGPGSKFRVVNDYGHVVFEWAYGTVAVGADDRDPYRNRANESFNDRADRIMAARDDRKPRTKTATEDAVEALDRR